MRVLLDANVPRKLRQHLEGHEVSTAREMGWNELPDSALLEQIGSSFDVLVTMDKSLPFQQRLSGRPFAVIILRARSNRLADLVPLVPEIIARLRAVAPGGTYEIGSAT